MTVRFIGKNLHKKVVRPMKNSAKYAAYSIHKGIQPQEEVKIEETTLNEIKVEETNSNEEKVQPKKENKRQKKNKEMVNENKLAQMEIIAGTETTQPNTKIMKSNKGLFERTDNSVVLLTEDNKMLLND